MHQPLYQFDTLAYANKLKIAGMEPQLAEVQATVQAELVNDFMTHNFATKNDLQEVHSELKFEIQLVKSELKAEIQAVRAELKAEIQAVKMDLQLFKSEVNARFEHLENVLTRRMGNMFIGFGGILVTLMTIFHFIK